MYSFVHHLSAVAGDLEVAVVAARSFFYAAASTLNKSRPTATAR